MKKKVTVLTATILCAAGVAVGASSAGIIEKVTSEIRPDFKVLIDDQLTTFKDANGEVVYPMLYNGTTYLPLRAIGEMMGKTVYWYEADKRIELKTENTTVTDADVIITDDKASKTEQTSAPVKSDAPASGSKITAEQAKAIVLEKAGLTEAEVVFEEVSLDEDDGRYVYEIEFRKGKTEYSADVSIKDGTIVSWDVDTDN